MLMTSMSTIGTDSPWILSDGTKVGARSIDTSLTKAMIITGLTFINILAPTATTTSGQERHTRCVHCHPCIAITIETILTEAIVALVGFMIWHAHGKGVALGILANLAFVFDVLTDVITEGIDTFSAERVALIDGQTFVDIVTTWCAWSQTASITVEALVANTVIALEIVVWNTGGQIVTSVRAVKTSLSG